MDFYGILMGFYGILMGFYGISREELQNPSENM